MDVARDLDELAQLIRAAAPAPQLRSATSDADKLVTPGCWLRFDRARHDLLAAGAYSLDVTAHLVVGDQAASKAHKALSDLFTILQPTLEDAGYTGDALAFVGLVVQGSQTPLPALAVPLTLQIQE